MVFHTRAGAVAVKSLVDRHISGCRPHPADTGRQRIERMAMPDQIHFRHNLSRMWIDDRHGLNDQGSMGNSGRYACICTAFFSGLDRDGGRHSTADRLSKKAIHRGGGNGTQNGNISNHIAGHAALLVAAGLCILKCNILYMFSHIK